MNLSIIIVSWNIKEKLRENLKALRESLGDFSYEIFVVDNNSEDGSAIMVKKEFPDINLIVNNQNLGFSKANNQAIKKSRGEFVLLLNPDMKVMPDTLFNMLNWMKNNKRVDVAGCKLINENGDLVRHVRKFPKLSDQLAITLKVPHVIPSILNNYLQSEFAYDKAVRVDSIRGSFFMIRRETINKIGLLDENYYIWFEEVDFCKRVKETGGEVWYTPDAICIDYVGRSFSLVSKGKTQQYFRDSMLKYFKKWHPDWQYKILKLAWSLGIRIMKIGKILKIENKVNT